jgi:hypothetical protein
MDTRPLSAKEYLSQAYRIDQRINSKLEQIRSLRILAEKAGAALSEVPPDKNNRNVHRMEDVIVKMLDLEDEINADLQRLIDLKHEVVTIIKCVESPELQTLLELRYLCFNTWEEISVALHLDIRWLHRLHNKALNEVDAIRRAEP